MTSGLGPHPTANDLDARDPLASFAAAFVKPKDTIYLDGNSLGLLCRPAEEALRQALDAWRERAILGWTEGPEPWFDMPRRAATLLAPMIGADAADVMVGQSTTVNLHQLLATFYDPHGSRPRILIDEHSFPTDRYAVESHLRLRGRDPARDLVVVPSKDNQPLEETAILGQWTTLSGWRYCRRCFTAMGSCSMSPASPARLVRLACELCGTARIRPASCPTTSGRTTSISRSAAHTSI